MAGSPLFTKKGEKNHTNSDLLGLKTLAGGGQDCRCRSNCVSRSFVASRSFFNKATAKEKAGGGGGGGNDNECWASYGRGHGRKFPPAIPLLARTGNLSCHMPWVLERTYRSDGSLVIREVRVKHHEYFRACRADGRLVLLLVELDEANSPLFVSGHTCTADDNEDEGKTEGSNYEMSTLSSSMPEPAFPAGTRRWRAVDDRGSCRCP